MKLLHYVNALGTAIWELIKPGEVITRSDQGFPHTPDWPKNANPFETIIDRTRGESQSHPLYAIAFAEGLQAGSVVYLKTGRSKIGTACDNDIVLSGKNCPEILGTVDIDSTGLVFTEASADLNTLVNNVPFATGELFDQDTMVSKGTTFTVVRLYEENRA